MTNRHIFYKNIIKDKCNFCGSTKDLTFDHIIPISKGGSLFEEKNIQILCFYCNRMKNDTCMTKEDYERLVNGI